MALSGPGGFLSEDQFICSICLDVFTNPVSTPCGHSYCLDCISTYWDGGGGKTCVCPLCKESFRKRPELHINRTLKEITEQFKKMADGLDRGAMVFEGGIESQGWGGSGNEEVSYGVERPPVPPRPPGMGVMPGDLLLEMKTRFQRPSNSRTPPPVLHPHPPSPFSSNTTALSPPAPPVVPRRYTLSGPADSFTDAPLCPEHQRGLEFFCRTDQTCGCAVCMEGEHHGHQVIPAKREWLIKKSQLEITEAELRDMITQREKKVEDIRTSLENIQVCAEHETAGSMHVFSALVSSVERSQAELLEVIEMSQRAAQHRGQTLIRDLEQEISELRKRSATLTQLAQSDDYVLFFKTFSTPPQTRDWSDAVVTSDLTSGAVLLTVNQMVERFREELKRLPEICLRPQPQTDQSVGRYSPRLRPQPQPDQSAGRCSPSLLSQPNYAVGRNSPNLPSQPDQSLGRSSPSLRSPPPPEHSVGRDSPDWLSQPQPDQSVGRNPKPKVRRVQEYAVDITLDPLTAHPRLLISDDGKQVRCWDRYQPVADGPERFDRVVCVLGRQAFSSGRHYWEVEVGGKTDWDLGVASHSINRKGKIIVSPAHGYWFLSLRDKNDYAFRTEPSTALGLNHKPNRIGIYVDCDKGQVSFYNVDAKMLIYTFTDSFSDVIHPFFSPCTNKSGRNEAPLIICPVSMPLVD
ncbi:E3 ubiquitin/ISG15 ligase TRIM25 isoform X2 [Oncorhynchus keta]|uniref:E3 ubiquitin/ISG15 ligase TRIM25 isoform X1 n=1 Tax=Oncorhynchus keta TaxID=8018 RepID=UPI00227A32D7|nr:E3 ubiquitin/ISG15 ligase TRIM25 isoform X1 [Oncorhynchus keta]XP_052320949.1 E3 ubiquitin/ISG15 ligase TRIM25 isoform X2 [Oncorhynchus keta]